MFSSNPITGVSKLAQFAVLVALFLVLCLIIPQNESNVFWRLPALFADWPKAINDFTDYMAFEWVPVQVYDPDLEEYEQSGLLKEISRGFSRGVLFCIELALHVLTGVARDRHARISPALRTQMHLSVFTDVQISGAGPAFPATRLPVHQALLKKLIIEPMG